MNLEESIKLAVESLGARLYDITTAREHDRNIFRVLVTAEGGVTLDKCAEISRMISPILDVDEPMSGELPTPNAWATLLFLGVRLPS